MCGTPYTNPVRHCRGGVKPTVADIVVQLQSVSARCAEKVKKSRAKLLSLLRIWLAVDSGGRMTVASSEAEAKVSFLEWD